MSKVGLIGVGGNSYNSLEESNNFNENKLTQKIIEQRNKIK